MNWLTRRKATGLDPFSSFQTEMNDLMESFFKTPFVAPEMKSLSDEGQRTWTWRPQIDVSETDKEFKVKAELPGLKEEDIEVTFADNTLYLRGEKKFEKESDEENYHRVESVYGTFSRTIPFATTIDGENIKAEFENGILKVRLKKADEVLNKTRKIAISKQ